MSKNNIYRRGIAGLLAGIVAIPNLLSAPASAEETEKYQYNLFGRNGIELTADNFCSNGNWHTNKSVSVSCVNRNFNGTLTTEADIVKRVKHVYADQKIYNTYFTDNCELLEEEYSYTDLNININSPLFCYGNINLNGNVSLNSNLGTLMNLNITGEVKNANNSVVYSKYGNITIENNSTANINGLIYAPLGTLTINSPNVNINGIVIADKVVINGNCVNINSNDNIARFVGNISEAYDFSGLEYLPEEWLGDTDEDGLFDIYEKVIDNKKLSGWAGDLQSLIYNLKLETYGTSKDLNETAYSIIAKDGTYFSSEDMVSDIDAENIYNLYSKHDDLSYMLDNYYKEYSNRRYNIFVEGYGSIEELQDEVDEFTSGDELIKHSILNDYAKKAADNEYIKKTYNNSVIGYVEIPYVGVGGVLTSYYQPVHSLSDPQTVTPNESKALTYAFIKYISENLV